MRKKDRCKRKHEITRSIAHLIGFGLSWILLPVISGLILSKIGNPDLQADAHKTINLAYIFCGTVIIWQLISLFYYWIESSVTNHQSPHSTLQKRIGSGDKDIELLNGKLGKETVFAGHHYDVIETDFLKEQEV